MSGTTTVDRVTTIEDGTASVNSTATENTKLPRRPAYANAAVGTVQLRANCVELPLPPKIKLHYYDVKVKKILSKDDPLVEKLKAMQLNPNSGEDDPTEPKGSKLGHILYHTFNTKDPFRQMISQGEFASDFRNIAYTTRELAQDDCSFEITYRGEKSRYRDDKYKLTFEEKSVYSSDELLAYVQGQNQDQAEVARPAQNLQQVIQGLNFFLRHRSKNDSMNPFALALPTQAVVGSKVYDLSRTDDKAVGQLKGGLEAIRGCFSSIRPAAARLLLNVNLTFGPFYRRGRLRDLLIGLSNEGMPKQTIQRFIKGIRVLLTHRDDKKKPTNQKLRIIKRIAGFATKSDGICKGEDKEKKSNPRPPPMFHNNAPEIGATWDQVSFTKTEEDGSSKIVTVRAYFKDKYPNVFAESQKLKGFPEVLINVGTLQHPEYVPVSVCEILPGQSYRSGLTGDQTTGMIKKACALPKKLVPSIGEVAPKLSGFEQLAVNGRKVGTDFDLISLEGKRLAPPKIQFPKQNMDPDKITAKWNLYAKFRFTVPGQVPKWSVLVVKSDNSPSTARVDQSLKVLSEKIKIRFGDNFREYSERVEMSRLDIMDYGNKVYELRKNGNQLVLVWLGGVAGVSAANYQAMKCITDCRIGIHTILVNDKKAGNIGNRSTLQQYWDNVLLKVNLKFGGINQTITDSMPKTRINFKKTMVVGMDVTHPAPGSEEVPISTVGMVASIDSDLCRWPGTLYAQPHSGTEVVCDRNGMKTLLTPCLKRWKKGHGQYPTQILVYRDGVSEGQYEHVVHNEYKHMMSVCEELYGEGNEPEPKFTIVVVGKRHHMRFYRWGTDPKSESNEEGWQNPEHGTLVDRSVTSQFLWEFYLQAQYPLQGTARPAHYIVVVDNIFGQMKNFTRKDGDLRNPSDVLYRVTHYLSYTLGRATTATGVCAPAFLADKLCDRARCYNPTQKNENGVYQRPWQVHSNLSETMFYI